MYMPLMVSIERVVLFAESPLPSGLERGIVRQKIRALQPFIEGGLEIVRKEHLQVAGDQANWQDFLLGAESRGKADLAVSCLHELNPSLQEFCEEYGILCNVVDQKEYSNTWFMGVLQTSNLLLGISSKGSCPYYTAYLRRDLQSYVKQHQVAAALLGECRKQLQHLEGFACTGKRLHRAMYSLHHCKAFELALKPLKESQEWHEAAMKEQATWLLEEFFKTTDFLQRETGRSQIN